MTECLLLTLLVALALFVLAPQIANPIVQVFSKTSKTLDQNKQGSSVGGATESSQDPGL